MDYQKNQIVEVLITDIGENGEGIGKVDGYALFVKDALVGDRVQARLTKVKKNYAFARLEKLLTPSKDRTEPFCKEHRRCGGCQIQAMSYEAQLAFKQNKVRNNLIRLGDFAEGDIDAIMEPIVGMDKPYEYRNKMQFPIGCDRDGNPVAGFYAGRTHSIIPCTECGLGFAENREILEAVLAYMKKYKVPAYDEETGCGMVRHVLIRKGFTSGEIAVCLVCNTKDRRLPHGEELINMLSDIRGVKSISMSVNCANTNVIMGDEIITLWGADTISDEILGIRFDISPLSFYQVNPIMVEKLYGLAVEYAALFGTEEVWDICCGIGTISLCMAKGTGNDPLCMAKGTGNDPLCLAKGTGRSGARCVHGLEIVPAAIEDAKKNAEMNHIENVDFICAAAEEYLPAHKDEITADVVVFDPPRKGMEETALSVIADANPSRIVYVSCDSATLARDLKYLTSRGYRLQRVRCVDMFPHTVHVETVVLLSQQKPDDHIEIEINLDEIDATSAETKATYKEIQVWVQEKYGFHVTNLNIAQVKQKHEIIERENYNKPKSENSRQPGCPEEKVKAIEEALRQFQMIK